MNERFKELHATFSAEGIFEPSYIHVILRVVEFFLYFFMGISILQAPDASLALWGLGILLLTLAYGRVVFLAHEGGHCALLGSPKLDSYFQSFLYGKKYLFNLRLSLVLRNKI
jgi:fatty acid desaturase